MTETNNQSNSCCNCSFVAEQAKKIIPKDTLIYDCADFFKVFSDSTRMKILWSLDAGELCVCDISVLINMTKSATSHQLRYLKEMNLIKSRKQGKEVFYSLADSHIIKVFEISKSHVLEAKNEENC